MGGIQAVNESSALTESGTSSGPESAPTDTTTVEFGAALRDIRQAHNRELADVAESLRIRQVYLKAIEEGRFDDLPGPTYATGFVRAYADYLGLELDEVMRRYRSATGDIQTQAPLVPPSPVSEARLPTGFILLVAAVLAAGAYGGWYYLTLHGQSPTEVVSALPKRISDAVGLSSRADDKTSENVSRTPQAPTPEEKPVTTASSEPVRSGSDTGSVIATAVETKPAVEPAPEPKPVDTDSTTASAELKKLEETATPVNPRQEPQNSPVEQSTQVAAEITTPANPASNPEAVQVAAMPVNEAAKSRIVLRANVTSWVELREADGKRLISKLLRTGETYEVPGRSGIKFTTGNAGGIDILVDDQVIASLGPVGAVRRDIPMDPETLLTRKPGQR
ncbi:MAG: hypothetical protein CMM52_10405 [Rhodospirillaceae bacterium]|nr:hypothetical protein [Rhodospirillaceae bacterium]|tara:strand:- start:26808 stop:27986 length:1179 start_codon:yes stop_codon:yes gene_type:complete